MRRENEMKRKWMLMGVILMAAGMSHAAQEMSVQVREGQLRERPSYLGTVVASVAYGERVSIQRRQGPWQYVASGEKLGWIHESALTRQRIVFEAGEVDVAGAATQEEMALAGKGFSAEVEDEFRAQNVEIDFSWVDRMEKMGVSAERLTQFLRAGGLTPSEGGR